MRSFCLVLSLVVMMSVGACGNKKNLELPKNSQTQNQQQTDQNAQSNQPNTVPPTPAGNAEPSAQVPQTTSSNPASAK